MRTKRNLLIVSGVAIFAFLSKLQITSASFLGFKFSNPEVFWLDTAVLSVLGYLFVQFFWKGWDFLQLTRIRITGTRLSHQTAASFASKYGDYPSEPIQSSLYHWWASEAKQIGNLSEMAKTVHRLADELEEVARQPGNIEMPNINHVISKSTEITNAITSFEKSLDKAREAIESARIPVSLERFNRWFFRFESSQICRLLILDVGFPFCFGLTAIALWAYKLINPFLLPA